MDQDNTYACRCPYCGHQHTAPILEWQQMFTFTEATFLHDAWRDYVEEESESFGAVEDIYTYYGGEIYRDVECERLLAAPPEEFARLPDVELTVEKLRSITGDELNEMFRFLDHVELN